MSEGVGVADRCGDEQEPKLVAGPQAGGNQAPGARHDRLRHARRRRGGPRKGLVRRGARALLVDRRDPVVPPVARPQARVRVSRRRRRRVRLQIRPRRAPRCLDPVARDGQAARLPRRGPGQVDLRRRDASRPQVRRGGGRRGGVAGGEQARQQDGTRQDRDAEGAAARRPRFGSFSWRTAGRAGRPRPGGGGVQGRRVAEPQHIRRAADAGAQGAAAASPARVTASGGRLTTPRRRPRCRTAPRRAGSA